MKARFVLAAILFLGLILQNNLVNSETSSPPTQPHSAPLWNDTWTDRLKRDLFLKYDKFARPTQHYNTTKVMFNIILTHVTVDELKSSVTVNAWAQHFWRDEKLQWNSSDYGGVTQIQVGNHEVWQPDIVLYNSATPNSIEYFGDTHFLLHENGLVNWAPPSQFIALCDLDLRYWPYDVHVCSLTLGSWTFHGEQIDLQFSPLLSDDQDAVIVSQNVGWKVINITRTRQSVVYECCSEPYITLYYNMTLKRTSLLHKSIVVAPATAVVFLTLVTFWLPSHSESKLIISACTLIIIVIYLVYFGMKIPITNNPPLIVLFYSGCLCQVTVSLIVSTIVINLSRRAYCEPLPRKIKSVLFGWLGRCLGLSDQMSMILAKRRTTGQELRGNINEDSTTVIGTSNEYEDDRLYLIAPTKSLTELEWILAATAIDRIIFLLFCLVFAIMGGVYMS
ncbi:neuronal acetylcholine receptor subunit alpha-5-like [Prorops nasuta]|uniref:neuronal acetylcholine receptor subunit alpha-5-like n=1 Tax=Prorops nasuta TaxID=863751 RepID=UPI0034CD16DA